jgi:exopolysaccharide biosynthesis polyprenyl glycosylphosphotransferase
VRTVVRAGGPATTAPATPVPPRPQRSTLARYRRLALSLAASDAICIWVALAVAFVLRYGFRTMFPDYALTTVIAPMVWLPVFYSFGLYRQHHLSDWDEFRRIFSATSVAIILAATASFWTHSQLSRKWIAFTWVFALFLELLVRMLWRHHAHRLRRSGALALRTVIVGGGVDSDRLRRVLCATSTGFLPIGCVLDRSGAPPQELPVIGRVDDLESVIREYGVECMFCASRQISAAELTTITRAARDTGTEVRLSTGLPMMLTSPVSIQPIAGSMTVTLRGVRLSGVQYAVKRSFDLAATSMLLVVFSPLMAACAVAVRMSSPGPVLFRQERVTRGNRTFTMFKFRSMRVDAEDELDDDGLDRSAPFFKVDAEDPRVTRTGRFLRSWSLDELPQLWNVVRGDMSLVGPRPLPAEQVAANPLLLEARHEVSAGVSGWWQIRGRSNQSAETAVALDLFYIENWSLALDMFILLKTAAAVLARRGAH